MQEEDVVVRVQGLVRVHCSHDHRTVVPVDVGPRLAGEVDTMLLTAGTRGLLSRRAVCGDCGTDLTLLPRVTDTPVPTDLDGHVVTPVVEAPMTRCPGCGREQLGRGTARRVARVLRAAVRTADE